MLGSIWALSLAVLMLASLPPDREVVAPVTASPAQHRFIDLELAELNDPVARYDITDVASSARTLDFRRPGSYRTDTLTRCRWYRFRLSPALERQGPWVIYAAFESATLFEPTEAGYRAERFGLDTSSASRRFHNGLPDINVLRRDFGRPLYLRISGSTAPGIIIETLEQNSAFTDERDLRCAFFTGIFGVLALLASVFALITRLGALSYYALYMASQTVNVFAAMPYANRVLWPESAPPDWLLVLIFVTLSPLALNQFFRYALETKDSPILDKILIINATGTALVGALWVWYDYNHGSGDGSLIALLYMIGLAVGSAVVFVRWRQKYTSAGIYLIGLFGFAVGLGLFPVLGTGNSAALLGFTWEALAFFAAIAYRLVSITAERENALADALSAREVTANEFAARVTEVEGYKRAFERFVPREFLEQLGRGDAREVQLGDHIADEMTVLFCDIRSFVGLSEKMDPEATFDFLNAYFALVGPVIRGNHGFIDQYLGDGIKALFPASSDDALRAAIGIQSEIRRFNEGRAREGSVPIETGVALHRGRAILATIGEPERFDTTVVTEVVNVAARLEGLTKIYGAKIIASRAIVDHLADAGSYNLRSLGELQLAGSAKSIFAYEVYDGDSAELIVHKRSTIDRFTDGIGAYRRGDFKRARVIFEDLAHVEPRDLVARFFAERSRRRDEMGSLSWDGVERHESKA